MLGINHLKKIYLACLLLFLTACNAHKDSPVLLNISNPQSYDGVINICRNSNFILDDGVTDPDILINEESIGKVPSGTKQIVGAQSGDQFKVAIF
jgi:hypothetical protein